MEASLMFYEDIALHIACKHIAPEENRKKKENSDYKPQNCLWVVAQVTPLTLVDLHTKAHLNECGHTHEHDFVLGGCLMNYKTNL